MIFSRFDTSGAQVKLFLPILILLLPILLYMIDVPLRVSFNILLIVWLKEKTKQ